MKPLPTNDLTQNGRMLDHSLIVFKGYQRIIVVDHFDI